MLVKVDCSGDELSNVSLNHFSAQYIDFCIFLPYVLLHFPDRDFEHMDKLYALVNTFEGPLLLELCFELLLTSCLLTSLHLNVLPG